MDYLFYIPFGILPSIIWLFFYLKKDVNPEPNRMILKIFFWGMLSTIPAVFLELGISSQIVKLSAFLAFLNPNGISSEGILFSLLYVFIGVAMIEEVVKYLVVRQKVLKNSEMDEPVDVMLYMIIAALGFAALENIFVLMSLGSSFHLLDVSVLSGLRFVGATFLHALCSGMLGYFMALSFFKRKNRIKFIVIGLMVSVFFHGAYNFSIMKIDGVLKFLIPFIILISLAFFVSLGFQKLKKMKSICKIKL